MGLKGWQDILFCKFILDIQDMGFDCTDGQGLVMNKFKVLSFTHIQTNGNHIVVFLEPGNGY